jgi:enamine deaminase RidA (YjgF/YER057c/UK114 family)
MPIETINPPGVAAPIGQYSHLAVVPAGYRLLLLAGQVGVTLEGTFPESVEDQFDQALANIGAILSAQGAGFADVAKVTYYFAERPADFTRLRQKMADTFTSSPAATLLFVAGLASKRIKVEVEVTAAVAAS